jgi:hypothetical protein
MSTGQFGTFDLTEGTKLSVEDLITMLDPHDVPLQGMFDAEGRRAIRKGQSSQVKEQWLDDTLLNPLDNTTAAATTSEGVLTVGNRLRFTTGDVLFTSNANDEYVQVTGYGTTANTLLISRAFSGTAATITSGAAIVGVGTALAEGSDPNDGRYEDRNARFNYHQIFGPYKVEVSNTEQVIDKYGISSTEMDYQVAKNIKQAAVAVEQAIVYGVRTINTSAKERTMGGFRHYITTNVDSTTTDLTEAAFRTQQQAIYDAGGMASWCLTGTTQKNKISQFSTSLIQLDRSDKTRGQVVDYVESDFATTWIMKSRWVQTPDVFLFDADAPELLTLPGRETQFVRLGTTGDAQKGFLVCEKTLKFHAESHAARFSALQA